MTEPKRLFATCSSGLCNRLLVLAGSIRIAERTGRSLALYWPVNQDLGCGFNDLFQNRIPLMGAADFTELLDTTLTVKCYNAWKTQGPLFRAIRSDGDPDIHLVIIKGWSYPMFENEQYNVELSRTVRRNLLALEPLPELQATVDHFPLPADTLGVHIRRGDHLEEFGQSQDTHFSQLMRAILKRRPEQTFFLATDVAEIEQRFRHEFGAAIIAAPKTWSGRHTCIGAREGLIDLLLLARAAAIIGNVHSSFSLTAGLLGLKRMIVATEQTAVAQCHETCATLLSTLPSTAAFT